MTKKRELYKIQITDTFGGEANFCWVRWYIVKAVSELGAVQVIARHYGAGWNMEYTGRYNLSGACVCMFVDWIDETDAAEYIANHNVDEVN